MASHGNIRNFLSPQHTNSLSESELVLQLQSLLIDPLATITAENDWTWLHSAVKFGHSPEFCKIIHDLEPSFVKTPSHFGGILPVHIACACFNVKTAMYLLEIYPESINIATTDGCYPLHLLLNTGLSYGLEPVLVLLEYLLKHDMDAVYAPGAIKLAVKGNPAITTVTDSQGYTLLHLACQEGYIDTVKCLVELDKESLTTSDANGNLALHHACLRGWCDIVIYLLGESNHGVTVPSSEKKLPIELLLYEAKCDRNTVEFVAAVNLLLRSCPDTLLNLSR
eukprot:scaffold21258_cov58-Cyclotella_meneghiniana.AAC.7